MSMLTPSQRGALAEAAVTAAAMELGLTVLRPLCEGQRYDLVIDCHPQLLRVQCKMARRASGALVISLRTNRCTPGGYLSTSYTTDEIDAVAAYDPDERRCYLISISQVANRRALHLRLAIPQNNQRLGIKWAGDYEFPAAIERLRAPAPMAGTIEVD